MSNSSTIRRLVQPAVLSLVLVFGGSCAGPNHNGDHCPDHAHAQEPAPAPPTPLPAPAPSPQVDPAKAFDSLDLPDNLEPADPKFIKANELPGVRKVSLRLGPNAATVKASKAEIEEIVPGFWVFKFGRGGTGSVVLLFTGLVGDEPVARMHQITVGSEPAPTPTPTPGPAPGPVPVVPEPSADMQTKVAAVKTLLATGDPAKKATLANVWADFAAAVQATPPQSIGAFKAATQQFINAAVIRAGLSGAFPGYTFALDQSFALTFGDQDGKLDAATAVAWAQALSWACK